MTEAPKSSPVTAEMLAELSPQAIAAWAGRCALRVQPLIRPDSFGQTPLHEAASHIETLDIAATLAMVTLPAAPYASQTIIPAADAATISIPVVDAAGNSIQTAARAACAAARTVSSTKTTDAVENAMHAYDCATKAAHYVTSITFAAATVDYSYLIQSGNYNDLETFIAQPLWHSEETQSWLDIVNGWGEDLDFLVSQFPELRGIYKRHMRLLAGDGIDFQEARERIESWLKRSDSHKSSQGVTERGDKDSLRTKEQSEQSEVPTPQIPEAPAPDRRGAATSTLDAPTTDDSLDRKPLVQSLAAMFAAPQQATPFTLAILGDWGAGKSSVMDQLRKELASGKYGGGALEFLFATFNAWQYEHTDDIRAGLAQEVVSGLTQGLRFWERWRLTFRFAWAEHQSALLRTVVSFVVTLLAVSVAWRIASMSGSQFLQSVLGVGAAGGVLAFIVLAWKNVRMILNHPLATQLQTYLKLPDYGKHLGAVPVMKRHIKTICDLRGVREENPTKRLVVFIDDLDRCGHECIIQTFDAVRLVMDIPNVIVVIAIDYRIAFAAVANHYADLADDDRPKETIARDYLGKIIQLPVKLPKPKSMREFIRERLFATADRAEIDRLAHDKEFQSLGEKFETWIDAPEEQESESAAEAAKTLQEGERRQDGVEDAAPSVEPASVQSSQLSDDDDLIPQLMAETPLDCRFFEFWTGTFKFTNPRQLIRLRNSYRLLTHLEHVRGTRDSDKQRMAMLFWLELLHQKSETERKQYEDVLNDVFSLTVGDPEADRSRISDEITHLGIRPQIGDGLDDDPENQRLKYASLKTRVSRFVLPAMSVRSDKTTDSP